MVAPHRYANVLDFLHDEPARAPGYLAKGAAVFAAVEQREAEIDARFGAGVAEALLDLRRDLPRRMSDNGIH